MAAIVNKEKCTGCANCVEVCPVTAITIEAEKAVISEECIDCGVCVSECPEEAISLPQLIPAKVGTSPHSFVLKPDCSSDKTKDGDKWDTSGRFFLMKNLGL